MKSPINLIALTALFIGFVVFFFLNSKTTGSEHVDWAVGNQPTNFVLPQFVEGKLDKEVSLSLADYRGKVVYVDFWASWCKPCIASFPALDALYKKYQPQGFEIIAINLDNKPELAETFLSSHPVSYPVVFDDKNLNRQVGINAMPVAYYIDKKGTIRLIHSGFFEGDEKKVEKAIQVLLNE